MFKKLIKPILCLFVLGINDFSLAFSGDEALDDVQVMSVFPDPEDGKFLFLWGSEKGL